MYVKKFSFSIRRNFRYSRVKWLINFVSYRVVGPNNESKITKKIRYFTPFLENNEITNLEKIRYLSQNFSKTSGINFEICSFSRKIGCKSTRYLQKLPKLIRLALFGHLYTITDTFDFTF